MWLINAEILQLEEHQSPDVDATQMLAEGTHEDALNIRDLELDSRQVGVEYSILSHRWGNDELSMADFRDHDTRSRKQGFQKIQQCCRESLSQGIKYVWIDTCCIDKDKSAELTESINSMYIWYQAAKVCFAYFSDVDDLKALANSQWFKRGWTLQELIAPRRLMLYNRHWQLIGDRHMLSSYLSQISRVDEVLLQGQASPLSYPVAQRMRWMNERRTTRAEDSAYCLLGIFGVNMPLLYGEGGNRAFRRLQEEIIRSTYDHTIFAWQNTDENNGLLALSPRAFSIDLSVVSRPAIDGYKPYTIANGSISITLQSAPWHTDTYLALLECAHLGGSESAVGIFLRRLRTNNGVERWTRVSHIDQSVLTGPELDLYTTEGSKYRLKFRDRMYNVQQGLLSRADQRLLALPRGLGFRLTNSVVGLDRKPGKQTIITCGSNTHYNRAMSVLYKKPGATRSALFGVLDMRPIKCKIKAMKLFIDHDFNPVIFLAESSAVDRQSGVGSSYVPIGRQELVERLRPFSDRGLHDLHGWNAISKSDSGALVAAQSSVRSGLWMLKGDRVHGLNIELQRVAEHHWQPASLKVYLEPTGPSTGDPVYWTVELVNMPAKEGLFSSSEAK